MSAHPTLRRDLSRRTRSLVTPEGLELPMVVGSRGARAGALMLDLLFLVMGFVAVMLGLAAIGSGLFSISAQVETNPLGELLMIVVILLMFLVRYGYFMWFELGPRAATPGKRILGLRVAARDGGRLTAEMVIARNLVRDIELILPATYILVILFGGGQDLGVSGWALFAWLMIFMLLPIFNRDVLRAGDLVAGTWVVEAPRAKLKEAMSLAPDRQHVYTFGEDELSVYGEHELQVLEGVLRQDRQEALEEVSAAIATKIGWEPGSGDEREFLEAFYAALRGHLENRMRFGKRKADKFS